MDIWEGSFAEQSPKVRRRRAMVDGIVCGFQDMINVTDGRMEEWKNGRMEECGISGSQTM
jgi:hypothetical protein